MNPTNIEPITETDIARVLELDAKATKDFTAPVRGGFFGDTMIALDDTYEDWQHDVALVEFYRTITPRLARELAAAWAAIKVAREALLYIKKKAVFPLGAIPEKPWDFIESALAQLNTHTHE